MSGHVNSTDIETTLSFGGSATISWRTTVFAGVLDTSLPVVLAGTSGPLVGQRSEMLQMSIYYECYPLVQDSCPPVW